MMNTNVVYVELVSEKDVTDEIMSAAQSIVDGWYAEGRINWVDVWDRLDGIELEDGRVLDLGGDLTSPALAHIKTVLLATRRANQ